MSPPGVGTGAPPLPAAPTPIGPVAAVVAAWAVAALELVVVVGIERARLTGVWEVRVGATALLPLLLLSSGALGLAGWLHLTLLWRSEQAAARGALALLVGAAGGAAAYGVGGGRHLATLPLRAGLAAGVALVTAVAVLALARPLLAALRPSPLRLGLGAAAGVLLLSAVNGLVLVRLYPAFHLALAAGTLMLAAGCAALAVDERAPRARRSGALLVVGGLAASAALALPGARQLASLDNFRWVVGERAPVAGQVVALAARLAPPPPLLDDCAERPGGCPEPGAAGAASEAGLAGVDWRGRDVLLVTIDALRADHVGAYGYARPTTPELDALAAEGVIFGRAYAPTPHTSYSVTSLMTGKYLRPLLAQGAGTDSDTWAGLLRTYGYRTAAFYPPAVFFIDPARFRPFREATLGFEYFKVEFLEGEGRVAQLDQYLAGTTPEQRVFAWVHLFSPHEPYEQQPGHHFGPRDIDRYDSEIAAADATLGRLVRRFRRERPEAVIVVTADHGEEFGDHGGRYHGTTVYEEQVRVPLVVVAPGALRPRRIDETVQTIDLLPTVLSALSVPRPPRLRGRDLGPLLSGARPDGPGLALAETDEQILLAEGPHRLLCQRHSGACQLFDVAADPAQLRDRSGAEPAVTARLRARLKELAGSHGRYEVQGLRAEGKGWPPPILRGLAGDGDAAEEVAALLDDADVAIRRKAAEVLFDLRRPEVAPALRLVLARDEDVTVRRWAALALTRLGQGAPLARELLDLPDPAWTRPAALALAEGGDPAGAAVLIAWWRDASARDHRRSLELLRALAQIHARDAVWPLVQSLGDVRLRPAIAEALADIGEPVARVPLARALATERYQGARVAVATALVRLGATLELVEPLTFLLGVPDPLPGGLGLALEAGILAPMGGPDARALARLRKGARVGTELTLSVPRAPRAGGVRAIVRAGNAGREPATVWLGPPRDTTTWDAQGRPRARRGPPELDRGRSVTLTVAPGSPPADHVVTLPEAVGAAPGRPLTLVVYAEGELDLLGVLAVPLVDELPPPPPRPWKPGDPED